MAMDRKAGLILLGLFFLLVIVIFINYSSKEPFESSLCENLFIKDFENAQDSSFCSEIVKRGYKNNESVDGCILPNKTFLSLEKCISSLTTPKGK